jgi:protein involved in polysaccharide export with SLBB domain
MMMMDKVEVERPGDERSKGTATITTLDLRDPEFDPASFTFQAGDIIRVPDVRDKVYVMGAVWMPQAVDYREGWTVVDYLSATGGVVSPSDLASVRIIKFPMSEESQFIKFNFQNILIGKPEDAVRIEAGDIIFVPWRNQMFAGSIMTNSIFGFLAQTVGVLRLVHDVQ